MGRGDGPVNGAAAGAGAGEGIGAGAGSAAGEVLVTGAAGFIGGQPAVACRRAGYEVTALAEAC